jgi:hypothetical protein
VVYKYSTLKSGRRREDKIKMDLQDVGWGGRDWIDLDQQRDRWRALVNAVINIQVLQNERNFVPIRGSVSFSARTLFHGVS